MTNPLNDDLHIAGWRYELDESAGFIQILG
jgi:hypothetical protein